MSPFPTMAPRLSVARAVLALTQIAVVLSLSSQVGFFARLLLLYEEPPLRPFVLPGDWKR